MFTDITSPQNLYDKIKCRILELPDDVWKRRALAALIMMERSPWIPRALEDAVNAIAPGQLRFKGNCLDTTAAAETLAHLVEDYLLRSTGALVYTTEAAAMYLGLTVRGLKRNLYETGQLQGIEAGHSLVFTQKQLDEFDARRRAAGRPRKRVEA